MATKIKSQGDSRKATSITPASSDIGPITERDGKLQLRLTVKPGAQTNSITEITHNAICIRISAPPRDGEANKEVLNYVAKLLGIPKSSVELLSGKKSRHKVVGILQKILGGSNALDVLQSHIDSK
ncbi:hypothetical protein GGF37_004146 [Kickxella alabastrina]|nr:hypothetical protein GGF37_004146 [Kickxella alabastrina]